MLGVATLLTPLSQDRVSVKANKAAPGHKPRAHRCTVFVVTRRFGLLVLLVRSSLHPWPAPNTLCTADSQLLLCWHVLQASGYVEFDTAGQSNMYPVVTKAYETGSDQDTLETGSANFVVGVGAGAIAVAVLALGLTALSQQGAGKGLSVWCPVLC